MSRPLKYKSAADWRAVKEGMGWDAAGRPPRGAYVSMPESPPPPSRGWPRPALGPMGPTKAELARAWRVRQILMKHRIGEFRNVPLGWRI